MAARQGFSAQISQASEDAKQKLLSHAPLKSSWFSNLNTTCTIKSAPPRTPEVLSLLSIKSGWLWKRNEQHVWQARWCCVVPHTFLYYFDSGGTTKPPPPLEQNFQKVLNNAVKNGYGNRQGPRQSFNVFSSASEKNPDAFDGMETKQDQSPPAGIIDLECYSAVHRSSENELLLELAGDDSVNPDLRSFYFYCPNDDESVDWTQALLHNRHCQLQDEVDAFREVSAGFALQLQELHSELDFTKQVLEESQDECYSVRSSAEEGRRMCFKIVQSCLEEEATCEDTKQIRQAYLRDLRSARDLGTVVPAVQLLSEYTKVLEEENVESRNKQMALQERIDNLSSNDATHVKELQQAFQTRQDEWNNQRQALQQQIATLQQALQHSQKLQDDAQQEVTATKLEMTMYQNSTKQRLGELLSHKKILKKEVIDLRQKLDHVSSELSLLQHAAKTSMETVQQERQKSELLERYVERMESQVKVQQTMMGYMSASASVMGGTAAGGASVTSFSPRAHQSEAPGLRRNVDYPDYESEIQREHNQLLQRARQMVLEEECANNNNKVVDEDEKSHLSELTEDRTQKHFYAQLEAASPIMLKRKATPKRLPSYIGVQGEEGNTPQSSSLAQRALDEKDGPQRLDTIMSGAISLPPQPSARRVTSCSDSVSSTSKLSVAQRARQEADIRSCNSIRVRPPPKRAESDSSLLGSIGKSLTEVIDHSVLGLPTSSEESDDYDSSDEDRKYGGVAHSDAGVSEASAATHMSLQERQALQRAKQLAFLKEQGLIKNESNLRGGAGATPSPKRTPTRATTR